MGNPGSTAGGQSLGQAKGTISVDASSFQEAARVALASGQKISKELRELFRLAANEQRIALEQSRQATISLRTQQQQQQALNQRLVSSARAQAAQQTAQNRAQAAQQIALARGVQAQMAAAGRATQAQVAQAARASANAQSASAQATAQQQIQAARQTTAQVEAQYRQQTIAAKAAADQQTAITRSQAQQQVIAARTAARATTQAQRATGGGGLFGGLGGLSGRGASGVLAGIGSGLLGAVGGPTGLLGGVVVGAVSRQAQQMTQAAVEAADLATAYDRQRLAALTLAGSTTELTAKLEAYRKATGGVVSESEAISNVALIQAIGLGDTVAELEQFARAARGIQIATGRSTDFIVTQLQLAVSNQSLLRLDQLGLGIEEVQGRINDLQNANRGMTREVAYQQAVLGIALEKYGALTHEADAQATGVEKLRKAWADLRLELGQNVQGIVNPIADALEDGVNRLTKVLEELRKERERGSIERGADIAPGGASIRSSREGEFFLAKVREGIADLRKALADPALTDEGLRSQLAAQLDESLAQEKALVIALNSLTAAVNTANNRVPGQITSTADVVRERQLGIGQFRFNEEERAAAVEFRQTMLDIERDFSRQRRDAVAEFHRSVADLEEDFQRSTLREAQDFARQRSRAEADYQRAILDVREEAARAEAEALADLDKRLDELREDSAERIAEMQEDVARKEADIREESNDRLAELEEDYQRQRRRAMEDHSIALLDAAARLDAVAVAEEQRRFALEQRRAAEDHQERIDDEKKKRDEALAEAREDLAERIAEEQENLAERIADEVEAYEEQRQKAQEALRQRLADMEEEFRLRKIREDEDRAVRLERMRQDHEDQLEEMARAHRDRMQQIDEQEDEATQAAEDRLEQELVRLLEREKIYADHFRRIEDEAAKMAEDFIDDILEKLRQEARLEAARNAPPAEGGRLAVPTFFQTGGMVRRSGWALVHAGERVLTPAQQRTMNVGGVNATIVLGDIGSRSDAQVMAMMEKGMRQIFERFIL